MLTKLKNNKVLYLLIGLVLLSAIGFSVYRLVIHPAHQQTASGQATQTLQTAVVYKGDLSIFARGSGVLVSLDQARLGFGSSGSVSAVHVAVGDSVKKGDPLAIQGNTEQLTAAVASDQLALIEAEQNLSRLISEAGVVTAQAQKDLAAAESTLQKEVYNWNNKVYYVTLVNGKRVKAPDNYHLTVSPVFFVSAVSQLQSAWYELGAARLNYTRFSYYPEDSQPRVRAEQSLADAQEKFTTVLEHLLTSYPPDIQQTPIDSALTIAAAQVLRAAQTWERVKSGPDAGQVALSEQAVASARATLAVSQGALDNSVIKAPYDGVILSVLAAAGEDVSGPFITMADLSERYLQITLDGADLSKIAVGYQVEVVFDALPNQVFKGTVVKIDPNLYDPSGKQITSRAAGQVTVIKAQVKLDNSNQPVLETLPLGMSAAVDVIGGKAQNVLLVPVGTLKELSPGKYAVYVLENGEQRLQAVEVGLMDANYAEIKSGLKLGDAVVINP